MGRDVEVEHGDVFHVVLELVACRNDRDVVLAHEPQHNDRCAPTSHTHANNNKCSAFNSRSVGVGVPLHASEPNW